MDTLTPRTMTTSSKPFAAPIQFMINNNMATSWTLPMFRRFKKTFKQAATRESFVFDNQEYITAYAKYLIEYLEDHFAQTTKS